MAYRSFRIKEEDVVKRFGVWKVLVLLPILATLATVCFAASTEMKSVILIL